MRFPPAPVTGQMTLGRRQFARVGTSPLPCFAAVEDPEHQDGAAIVPVLKSVRATEHLQQEFAVFLAACYGSSQLRMSAEDVSPLDKFVRDARREVGKPFVEECRKSIEVGERVERPLDL